MSRKIIHEFKCQQPLSSFTKREKGEYCSECRTVVIDFSEKTNSEIIDIIKANNGNVCGSILKGQLEDVNEFTFGFRNKVAATGLAALLGIGGESLRAEPGEPVKTEIVENASGNVTLTQNTEEIIAATPAIETPDKPAKKKKERKRKTFMRIGGLSFYTQNVFPFIGARRMVVGKMKY
jgi:hypothetical protein